MKAKYTIIGMTCATCQSHVQKAVEKLGVKSVNVNLLTNSMVVEYDENKLTSHDIENAVKNSGYTAIVEGGNKTIADESKTERIKLILSVAFLIPLLYVSMGHMLGAPLPNFLVGDRNAVSFAFTQFILTIPIVFINYNYFTVGIKHLLKLKPNMDSLISIGAGVSLLYGIYAIYRMSYGLATNDMALVTKYMADLYFESAGTILTLVRVGKFLEAKSKARTTDAIKKMMTLAPKTAIVLENSVEVEKRVEDIKVGDIIIAKAGSSIAVDGKVIEGKASVDQANITGESVPVLKNIGDKVISSTIVKNGIIKIIAEKVGEDTTISNIIRLVEEAGNSKAPISRLADKVSGVFVPIVIGISLIAFIVWLALGYEFEFAMTIAVSVLVIACPCALGLATPVAIMVGTGKGAEYGLLIKSAESLERAHNIKTVVLDKTGTITEGKPSVDKVILYNGCSREKLFEILYAIENLSEHPLATSIVEQAKMENTTLLSAEDYSATEGKGVEATVSGKRYFVGNLKMAEDIFTDDYLSSNVEYVGIVKEVAKLATEGSTPLLVFSQNEILGIITIKDKIKQNSKVAISTLRKMNIDVVMLTGDNKLTANAIANEVGITHVIPEVLPTEKQETINSLKKDDKHLVAMVGDGVNDAPALTTSDVGIAIGAGTDIAIDSADIVLVRNDLLDVVNAIRLSKRVINNIKMNLFWAFFYNVIGILLATGAFYSFGVKLSPMIGALAMSLSSVCVVTNALTINFFKINKGSNGTSGKCDIKRKNTMIVSGEKIENCKNVCDVKTKICDSVCVNNKDSDIVCEKAENSDSVYEKAENIDKIFESQAENIDKVFETQAENIDNGSDIKNTADNICAEDNKIINNEKIELEEQEMIELTLKVNGMVCPHCEARVNKTLLNIDGVVSSEASSKNNEVKVVLNKQIEKSILINAINNEGYEVIE